MCHNPSECALQSTPHHDDASSLSKPKRPLIMNKSKISFHQQLSHERCIRGLLKRYNFPMVRLSPSENYGKFMKFLFRRFQNVVQTREQKKREELEPMCWQYAIEIYQIIINKYGNMHKIWWKLCNERSQNHRIELLAYAFGFVICDVMEDDCQNSIFKWWLHSIQHVEQSYHDNNYENGFIFRVWSWEWGDGKRVEVE